MFGQPRNLITERAWSATCGFLLKTRLSMDLRQFFDLQTMKFVTDWKYVKISYTIKRWVMPQITWNRWYCTIISKCKLTQSGFVLPYHKYPAWEPSLHWCSSHLWPSLANLKQLFSKHKATVSVFMFFNTFSSHYWGLENKPKQTP